MTNIRSQCPTGQMANTIHWTVIPDRERDGYVFLADGNDQATLHLLNQEPSAIANGELLGKGSEGTVYEAPSDPQTALKVFAHADGSLDLPGTHGDLEAIIAIEHGLNHFDLDHPRWSLRAPHLRGAFLPRIALSGLGVYKAAEIGPVQYPTIWAMERIHGQEVFLHEIGDDLAAPIDTLYEQMSAHFNMDGLRPENRAFVETKPWDHFRKGSLVLHDGYYSSAFSSFSR